MNEPEQNQPINPDEGQEAAGCSGFVVFVVGPVGTAGIRTVQPA